MTFARASVDEKFDHECEILTILQSPRTVNYTTITKKIGDILQETTFIYEIESLIECLILMLSNTEYLKKNYSRYYMLKYKYLVEYLTNEKYYPTILIKSGTDIGFEKYLNERIGILKKKMIYQYVDSYE